MEHALAARPSVRQAPAGEPMSPRVGKCTQCGCRSGWLSLHVTFCSACGRGGERSLRGPARLCEVLTLDDELPPMWVPVRPWQRKLRLRTLGRPVRKDRS